MRILRLFSGATERSGKKGRHHVFVIMGFAITTMRICALASMMFLHQ
jgi:hypothetical protein